LYHNSLVSKAAAAVIAGLGAKGYANAMREMHDLIQ
jgi:3-dehydroquinate dehydratase